MRAVLTSLHLIGVILLVAPGHLSAEFSVARVFGDNMVLQRGQEIPVWGWGDPGDVVTIELDGQRMTTSIEQGGAWRVLLPEVAAGGPYQMLVESGSATIEYNNVLVGDVWVCSGQSNMQWSIAQTQYQEVDTTFLNQNQVRMLNVAIGWDCLPADDITGGVWSSLSSENIQYFSAVAYHFGKALQKERDIPIGLINSSLGATAIETWMSNEALLEFEQFHPDIKPVMEHGLSYSEMRDKFELERTAWEEQFYLKGPGVDGSWHLPETDISDWGEINVPAYTDAFGLAEHDGAVWYRKEFDLPPGFDGSTFLLQLNQIRDYDITWVNGEVIGETYGRHTHRNYNVDASILKPTGNTLIVRTFDIGGPGGFTTNAFWGNPILLGKWQFKKGLEIDSEAFPRITMPNVSPFSSPGVLYNTNIAPLTQLPITGVIWYQGEANEYRAHEYSELLPAMIADWRDKWGVGDFPFLVVQLANYKQPVIKPAESQWAEVREAQLKVLNLPNTGVACAIDIGEANDIHPRNKEDVGKRLALAARAVAYDEDVVSTGPLFDKAVFNDREVKITFDNCGEGLRVKNNTEILGGFAVADESREFVWAQARIESNNTVVVTVPQGINAVAVRYAWGDNPIEANLYNGSGLPAFPFRTDDWPGLTYEVKYDADDDRF